MKRFIFTMLAFLFALSLNLTWTTEAKAAHAAAVNTPVSVAARIPPNLLLNLSAASALIDFSAVLAGSGATVGAPSITIDVTARVGVEGTLITAQAGGDLTDGANTILISRLRGQTTGWVNTGGTLTMTPSAFTPMAVAPVTIGTGSGNGSSSGALNFEMDENIADVPSAVDYTATVTIQMSNP
ncbi:MAG TPA: hypothetical protein VIU33_06810 [Nitrospiria bacterium]